MIANFKQLYAALIVFISLLYFSDVVKREVYIQHALYIAITTFVILAILEQLVLGCTHYKCKECNDLVPYGLAFISHMSLVYLLIESINKSLSPFILVLIPATFLVLLLIGLGALFTK